MDITKLLAQELNIRMDYAENIIKLIDEGNTIPFIARYRKELTGSMDDQLLREFFERLNYLRNLDKRRSEITASIDEQGKLTESLSTSIEAAKTLAELEDIYRPFKPKRRTRATIAKERGLEPLSQLIFLQAEKIKTPEQLAEPFIKPEKDVPDAAAAILGAQDIIAEMLSDHADLRKLLRDFLWKRGIIATKNASDDDSVYRMYYDFSEPVSKIQNHRILAINRGERENFLKVKIDADEIIAIDMIKRKFIKPGSTTSQTVELACEDAYTRLIFPSLEREVRSDLTERASTDAIRVFSVNLKQLLMQPPIKGKTCLAIDPAYRTGCKIAVCDPTGLVLDTTVIYPTPPQSKTQEAKRILTQLIEKHNVQMIAIGNGTASKESEIFASELIHELNRPGLAYMMVSEAGASVYSASKLAAAEFPQFDVSLRSAVSISRRLQDPLAELVKIDPKAIGVGQYQHDMPQAQLSDALGGVVESCVNSVGVNLNTASPSLLGYVSGLNASVAKNIVLYREENGAFVDRTSLKKVSKLGPKAFEQCAGFLRILDGKNVLDQTAVHPESYSAAKNLLSEIGYSLNDVKSGNLSELHAKIQTYGEEKLSHSLGIGVPTLRDIAAELVRPGRDIRDELPPPMLRTDVMDIKDLAPGMEMQGTVRNVIDFGAFIDIGVHQDGMVHISKICDRFIRHPSEVLKVGDIVTVWVDEVDVPRKRIALTMKKPAVLAN